jgi:hypothetical protein
VSLLRMGLVAGLALGAMTPSAAASKLVLKEEGKPVAAGADIGVELEMSETAGCKPPAQRSHLGIGAKKDRLFVDRAPRRECSRACCEINKLEGGLSAIAMTDTGEAVARGWPLTVEFSTYFGPNSGNCRWVFTKFLGKFPVPGHAVVEGSTTGKLNRRESFSNGEPCRKSLSASFVITLLGGNNKRLETEVVG